MIRAYDELYLGNARRVMAHMLDRAVYGYGMELREFYSLFLVSSISSRFQKGDCSVIAGRSGAELARMVLEETGREAAACAEDSDAAHEGRSREYWTGWALAYFQWYSSKTFEEIDRRVSIVSVRDMYPRYHEMDILQFCDSMEERIRRDEIRQEVRLSFYRKRLGLSQSQLADAAEIPVRTIQQYEQRRKNINKAQAAYLIRLARVLGCKEAELIEPETVSDEPKIRDRV